MTSSTGYAKDSSSEMTKQFRDRISRRYQSIKGNAFAEWMRWNGAYVYAYGCSLAGIICAIVSPLIDMLSLCFLKSSLGIKEIINSLMFQKSFVLVFHVVALLQVVRLVLFQHSFFL